jgi:hypothetical protein
MTGIRELAVITKNTNEMRQIIVLFFIFFSTFNSIAQKPEANFIDNFKTSKWNSIDNFNDSTILQLQELKLVKWNPTVDSLKDNPRIWIFNDEFKIKYYHNITVKVDSGLTETKRSFNTLNCKYSYDSDKGLLTITMDNKDKSTLVYKTAIVSTGSFILLTRTKQK